MRANLGNTEYQAGSPYFLHSHERRTDRLYDNIAPSLRSALIFAGRDDVFAGDA